MARLTPRRRAWTAVALVAGLAVLATGVWALDEWKPFHDEPAEVVWSARLRPLAEFVEDHTRLRFAESVRIEYVEDPDDFAARAGADQPPTEEQLAVARDDEALGRALGYWSRDTPLGDPPTIDPAVAVRGVSARWLADDEVLLLKVGSASSPLRPAARVQAVHELTLALAQQQFDTRRLYAAAETAQDRLVVQGLERGLAAWVRDEYLDEHRDEPSLAAAADDRPSALPLAYVALQGAPRAIGETFIEALSETRRRYVAEAFRSGLPDSVDQMVQPATKYLQRDPLEPVDPPVTPDGARHVATRQLGHTGLYLMLAIGLSPQEALTAADGWGDDAATVYRLGGRVCVDLHVVADSRADADRIERGLNAWALTRPDEAEALVGRAGTDLYATVCDPGEGTRQKIVLQEAVDLYFARAAAMRAMADATGSAELAECMAVRWFQRDEALDGPPILVQLEYDPTGEFAELRDECLASA